MKKIMLSAAVLAALIGTATAATTVTSANTVGYQENVMANGYTLNAPAFMGVGTDGLVDLSKLKLINAKGDSTELINFLDEEGMNTETWAWLTKDGAGMDDGWYDYVTWASIKTSIKKCEGYLMCAGSGVSLQSAGQVRLDDETVTLKAGYTVTGNTTPISIDLQSIKLIDAKGDSTEMINFLDAEGMNTQTWAWLTEEGAGMEDGWYDYVTWKKIEYTVKPGEAFLFGVSADVKVVFPGVTSATTK